MSQEKVKASLAFFEDEYEYVLEALPEVTERNQFKTMVEMVFRKLIRHLETKKIVTTFFERSLIIGSFAYKYPAVMDTGSQLGIDISMLASKKMGEVTRNVTKKAKKQAKKPNALQQMIAYLQRRVQANRHRQPENSHPYASVDGESSADKLEDD